MRIVWVYRDYLGLRADSWGEFWQCINMSWLIAKKMVPYSLKWYPVKGQVAVGRNSNTGNSVQIYKKTVRVVEDWNSCQESLQNLYLWRYSNFYWIMSWEIKNRPKHLIFWTKHFEAHLYKHLRSYRIQWLKVKAFISFDSVWLQTRTSQSK